MAKIIRRREQESAPIVQPMRFDPFWAMRELLGWDPLQGLEPFRGRMERVYAPEIELKETRDGYVVKADLPGVEERDVDVSVTGNVLTISGKREEGETQEGERYYTYERSYGSFARSFTLPPGTDTEKVEAELRDGVLTVKVPKLPEVQPKRIVLGSKALGGAGEQQPPETGKGKKAA